MNHTHTSNLVLSLVINGHDTSLPNVMKVTGCTIYDLKEALPLLKAHMFKCPQVECLKLTTLNKAIWSA